MRIRYYFYIDIYFDIYTVRLYELILMCSLKIVWQILSNYSKKYLTILTTTITHPVDNYKKQVENAEAVFGVERLHKIKVISRKNNGDFQAEDVKSSNKRKIREVSYLWYEECYKFGEKQVRKTLSKVNQKICRRRARKSTGLVPSKSFATVIVSTR